MASKKFGDTNGSAIKNSADAYKYKDGENTVRLIGDILPRYVYWLKGTNDKDIPVECLSFDREKEKFLNKEKDHVTDYFPDKKCSWAYSMNCIDPTDGKIRVLNLKKKLFEQIKTAAEDLGDPTDPVSGWDVVFKRAKTGPLAFNVEYTLNVLRCKPRTLSEAEVELVSKAKTIEELVPRPTADDIKALMEKITSGVSDEPTDASTAEAVKDLD
jgi:hypothetical protein